MLTVGAPSTGVDKRAASGPVAGWPGRPEGVPVTPLGFRSAAARTGLGGGFYVGPEGLHHLGLPPTADRQVPVLNCLPEQGPAECALLSEGDPADLHELCERGLWRTATARLALRNRGRWFRRLDGTRGRRLSGPDRPTDARVAKWEQTGEKPSPVMVWTPEQTGAFLDFVGDDRLYAMWHLIAFRGLRRGEACGQPWSETNLDDHSLTVSAQLVQDGWEVETSEPKTDSGFRVVALDDDTVSVLKRHLEQQDADREEWGSAWVDTGMVFTQEDGSWLHPGKVTDLFERLVAASGLPPIRLHDLRHGAATLMLAAGIDVKIVSDTLGHSDTRITRDIYQSVLPQVGKNAAEATAKLVPLQRKTEAEEAARKAAKKAKDKAKAEARAKKKGKRKKPRK